MMEEGARKLVVQCWASCSKTSLEMCRSGCPLDTLELWNALSEATGCLPIVDGHSRMSRRRDTHHVIAFMLALNSPLADFLASIDPKSWGNNTLYDSPCIVTTV